MPDTPEQNTQPAENQNPQAPVGQPEPEREQIMDMVKKAKPFDIKKLFGGKKPETPKYEISQTGEIIDPNYQIPPKESEETK